MNRRTFMHTTSQVGAGALAACMGAAGAAVGTGGRISEVYDDIDRHAAWAIVMRHHFSAAGAEQCTDFTTGEAAGLCTAARLTGRYPHDHAFDVAWAVDTLVASGLPTSGNGWVISEEGKAAFDRTPRAYLLGLAAGVPM